MKVDRGVDARYLQSVLTKDITTLECIYDLIDNAIDAARDRILSEDAPVDDYGLPANYTGYRILIKFEADAFSISDNCGGIDEETLAHRAFVTGSPSSHPYGIGWFGIGLKRALMKLGTTYSIRTDTGSFAASIAFGEGDFGLEDGQLTAEVLKSVGSPGTEIRIEKLKAGIRREFSGGWRDGISKHLSRRYGLYVAKGLEIHVDGVPIPAFGPGLRKVGPVQIHSEHFCIDGVDVFVDSGMHESYRIKTESDWMRDTELTDQYGWYFVCNDRIIRIAAREAEIGFTASWHQEYYGWIGWVRFVARDAEHLPWDTKKASIDVSSSVFQEIKGHLQRFADAYRSEQRKARTPKEEGGGRGGNGGGAGKKGGGKGSSKRGKHDPQDHNNNWKTLLPVSLEVALGSPKIGALVYEAKELEISRCYAGSMLFRAIMEAALLEHVKKGGHYKAVKDIAFEKQSPEERAKGEAQKGAWKPTLLHLLTWINRNDEYFPAEIRRECTTARMKFQRHIQELNGVVHESDLTNSDKLRTVRDDSLPLLQFLLSTPPNRS